MGFKVIIAENATSDLSRVVRCIARDNPTAAVRVGHATLARFQMLERFPLIGRIVPERNQPEWREVIYKSWRLIHRVDERRKVVYAARVWHGARGEPEFSGTPGN